ncbi:MFS transporter [Paenibacillus popilliae]|uniref:DHA2 family efflux MFS transporter permease subunit n=1 Tax=Paenibacillus popilliae TaxID=78057 RepID=A0ABY3AYU0_PAEPP|nr:MFS transporter [Paenibacillus sp. SDF0028]TQR46400.1 DHA2 family efflux MFS transporter permease subunit [Paenibacillus sp. SDF0028]
MNEGDSKVLEAPNSRKWWALAAVCFGLFMALLDVTIVNVALPTIQKSLNASFSELQWVIDAYALAFAVVLVTSSRLGDIFGRKKVFIIGLVVFSIGSLLCALSGDFTFSNTSYVTTLNISRAIQGLGASAMMPLSLSIISTEFQGKERGVAFGIWGGVSGLATAVGPLLGGILVEKVNWQSIFYINIPIGIIGIIVSMWAIRESREERSSRFIDIFGLVTLSVSMFCLVLALMQGNDKGWSSPYILTLFGIAVIVLLIFVVGELKIKNPMIDPRLFKIPSFTGASIAAFCLSAGFYSLFFYITLYLQNFLGFDSLQAGLRILPISALVLLGAPLAGKFTDKFGPKWFIVSALGMLSAAVFLMTLISSNDKPSDWIVLLPAFIIAGIANGMANPPISTLAMGTVHPSKTGMASGISNVSRQIGTAFGIAFLGAMLSNRYNIYLHDKITALNDLPAVAKENIITGVQKAGTIAGSLGLPGDASQNPYAYEPIFPTIQQIARTSFVDGTIDIFKIAGFILAAGTILTLLLIRNKDMVHNQQEK